MDEVQEDINRLKRHNPQVVALSAHDSCDASIEAFRNAFPGAYRAMKVGESILLRGED